MMRLASLLTIVAAIVFGLAAANAYAQEPPFEEEMFGAALADELDGALAEEPDSGLILSEDAAGDRIESYEQHEEATKGWKVPQPSFLKQHGFELGGWLEQGITFSNYPNAPFQRPGVHQQLERRVQMNQFWMFLDRPAKNDGEGWAWAHHLDMIYGTDWRIRHLPRLGGPNQRLQPPILWSGDCTSVRRGGIQRSEVKVGHYAGILGYEVVAAPPNPFYSHSYAMAFSEPILVTGALAEYKLSQQWAILGGIDRGWMTFEDTNNIWDFMGGVRWTSCNKKTSVAYSVDTGPQDPDGVQQRFVSSLVFKHQFTDRFQYVLQHDLGQQKNTAHRRPKCPMVRHRPVFPIQTLRPMVGQSAGRVVREKRRAHGRAPRPTPDSASGRWAALRATSTR